MTQGLDVLMLLTDGFGGRGGIAKFNRDFLQALDGSALVKRVQVLPRLIPGRIEEPIPESVVYDRAAAAGRVAFVRRLATHALRNKRIDLVVCGHVHLLPAAWVLARLRGARLALVVHGVEAWARSGKFLANRLAHHVDAFIAVSRCSAERFTSWSRVPMERAFILPNCVDLDTFRPQPRDPALQARYRLGSSKVILTVGRMASQERYKGFDEVIEQMPRLAERFPDLKYLIVGGGDDAPRLEEKTRALGVSDRVVFAGAISESEKVAHYNLADVYVMPSTGEGFGIVLIEAAACGVPVVGSRCDGSREALLDGRLGRLVNPKSPSQLIEAISGVLQDGSDRRRNEAIDAFSIGRFRTRVANWVAQQAALALAPMKAFTGPLK
jgi:glycosyltransferase involved in cell wall biosynthesis